MIGRIAAHVGALVVGVVLGAVLVLVAGIAPAAGPPAPTPSPQATDAPDPGSVATPPAGTDPLPTRSGGILLAWTAGGLPDSFSTAAVQVSGVHELTEVLAGRLDLVESRDQDGAVVDPRQAGWAIPLDALAVDPSTFAPMAPTGQRPVLERLRPGTVILGETSATLRRIDVGGQLLIGGAGPHTVVGVVDDAIVGAAEVVLHRDDPAAADLEAAYVLLRHEGERPALEAELRAVADGRPLRVRAPGETPYLRHGDAVLPQSILKRRFGEFRYRPPGEGERLFDVDPGWVDEHVVTRTVPILGRVTCHRAAVDSLAAVMRDLDRAGLAHTVDSDGYEGCWHPRLVSVGGGLSRHSWGVAVDINATRDPTGAGNGQPDAVVERFTGAGWGWGGTWLEPDPMHFELVGTWTPPIKVLP